MSLGIIIVGALGRMGKEIAKITLSDPQFELRGVIEVPSHACIGKDYGNCIGMENTSINICSSLEDVTTENVVCIDFSSPASLSRLLPAASKMKVPLVIGTTGLTDMDTSLIASFSGEIPILVSPNMSLGVNLLFLLTEMVASRLKNSYDIEIIEAHHRFKKDAPSGTARRLGEIVAGIFSKTYDTCVKDGRAGISSEDRPHKEIGMHSVRGGDIVGDHTVLFAGIGERIELRHQAHNRSTFARGALLASAWLSDKKSGLYSMRDMLGF